MSTTLTGTPSNVAPTDPSTITAPVDGDALNAASISVGLQKLIDIVAILRGGYATDDKPSVQMTAAIVGTRKLWAHLKVGTYYFRIYKLDEGVELVINAAWDATGAVWNYDSGTKATRLVLMRDYLRWERYAGATGWIDASWVKGLEWTSGVDYTSSVPVRSTLAISGTSEPTTTPVAVGAVYKDNVCHGWARGLMVAGPDLQFTRGFNVTSFDRLSAGKYKVTFALAASNHLIPWVTACTQSATILSVPPSTITTSAFEIWSHDAAGVLAELSGDDILTVGAYEG